MEQKTIYALGFFDGVHLGHQELLAACRRMADAQGCRAGVVTFLGHPDTLVSGITPPLINTPADRARLLKGHGIEDLVELPFDRALMETDHLSFLKMLVSKYGAAGFVCGHDFRFGRKGEGNAEKLEAFCHDRGLSVAVVPEKKLDGVTVSSTHIRSLLEQGDMEQAAKFLGHPHMLSGQVVPGRQLGRTIGIPTANLLLPDGVVVPRLGVYAGICLVEGKEYMAVTNIGSRPTVEGHQVRSESWLLDFDGELYGKPMQLQFYKFLRPERKFPSLEELQTEILKNAEQTRKYFKEK